MTYGMAWIFGHGINIDGGVLILAFMENIKPTMISLKATINMNSGLNFHLNL